MRLGLRPTVFQPGTESWCKARRLYGGAETVYERHRHRYEVNPTYIERLQTSGLEFIGKDEKGERMQMLELRGMLGSFYVDGSVSSDLAVTRTSVLLGTASASRILHSSSESVTSISWLRGGGM